jgi:type II secretory pathway pseudopilin PulG
MAATKLKTGVITAVILASVVGPLWVQHAAQARLNEQDETRRRQTSELAQLTADNQRLSSLLAEQRKAQPLPDNQFRELLRLRGEVGRLKYIVQEETSAKSATPQSPEDQLASMKIMYAARVDRLKQWLEANPSEKIPELQKIPDETWINAVSRLETDEDFARCARILRANAELQVLGTLWSALRKYAPDNDGQFPTDLSQLKPYFKSPIDDAILQRYEILPASSLIPELQPGGDWVITQAAPVNAALDLRMAYGLTNTCTADERLTNRWTLVR